MPGYFIKIIGDNLSNLEELFLGNMDTDNNDSIECLVTGCPKLKVLHVTSDKSSDSARSLLLGLPNLIEFKHPAMVLALEQIIKDGETEKVSALCNLYIGDELDEDFDLVVKSAQVVLNHLGNITKLDLFERCNTCNQDLRSLHKSFSRLTCLTHLTITYYSRHTHVIVPIAKAVGHQLKLLDICCWFIEDEYRISNAINQCRELRILRIKIRRSNEDELEPCYEDYGCDPTEELTPFCYLHELHLEFLMQSCLKPALCKSLFASPLLQEVTLLDVANFTDHVLKDAFNHTNHRGEQLAFTSLRKLTVHSCDFISDLLGSVVTDERVPLEYLRVTECCKVTEMEFWFLGRFQMDVVVDQDYDSDYD